MKRNVITRTLSWGVAVLLTAGCAMHEIQTEDIEYSYAAALSEGYTDSLLIDVNFEWPVRGLRTEALERICQELNTAVFGNATQTDDLREALEEYSQQENMAYVKSSTNLRETMIRSGDQPTEGMLSWVETIEGRVLEPYRGMQSYLIYKYMYTGGAHGLDSKKGLTFRLSDGEPVSEDDLFRKDYQPELSKILSRNLPKSVSKEVYNMLFVRNIEPNGNFYVDPEGITYIYERYEIGPYVSGLVRVSVPWSELKDILK